MNARPLQQASGDMIAELEKVIAKRRKGEAHSNEQPSSEELKKHQLLLLLL